MKRKCFLLLLMPLMLACSKERSPVITPVTPPVTDTIVSQYGTPFGNVPDRQDAVIYQVNMRVFSPQANFQGVIARLDSIKSLGVNVIYLMPIFPVGAVKSVNSPYCVKNYTAVNAEFGTLTDLRSLVDGAHSRNICVILDWVANHTAWDNDWITSHKDWYMQDGAGNIISPPGKGWNNVAQLDFTNAAMRLQMIKNMKYWVFAANVDGFRCDYADGPPPDFWTQAIDTLRHISTHKLLILAEGNRSAAVRRGLLSSFGNSDIVAFTKELAGEKVLVLSNLRNSVITFPFPVALQNSTWANAMTGETIHLTSELVLQPYSYVIAKQ